MRIKYEIRDSKSSYCNNELEFSPKENTVHIEGGYYFTNEIIKALQGIEETQRLTSNGSDFTLNQIETKINGLLYPPKEIEQEGDQDDE